jgi:hypothetical protein
MEEIRARRNTVGKGSIKAKRRLLRLQRQHLYSFMEVLWVLHNQYLNRTNLTYHHRKLVICIVMLSRVRNSKRTKMSLILLITERGREDLQGKIRKVRIRRRARVITLKMGLNR